MLQVGCPNGFRWLGNDYFSGRGAEVMALARTAATQAEFAAQHMDAMQRFLGERMQGTKPLPAPKTLTGDSATLELLHDNVRKYGTVFLRWLQVRSFPAYCGADSAASACRLAGRAGQPTPFTSRQGKASHLLSVNAYSGV